MYVGFRGSIWSGGPFESNAATPEEAAEEVFQKIGNTFPEEILEAIVTDFPKLACVLRRNTETGKWTRTSEADMSPFAGLDITPDPQTDDLPPAPRARRRVQVSRQHRRR